MQKALPFCTFNNIGLLEAIITVEDSPGVAIRIILNDERKTTTQYWILSFCVLGVWINCSLID
jgi:hypothetical protein